MKKKQKYITIYQNPYYDFVTGNPKIVVPSKTVRYKDDRQGNILTGRVPKGAKEFERHIRENYSTSMDTRLPFTKQLLVVIEVQLQKKDYAAKDVDNLAKGVLDAFKGIIYVDDMQIAQLFVEKKLSQAYGFLIGVKVLGPERNPLNVPRMLSLIPYRHEVNRDIR